jgi:putative MATE family efflux protein
MSNSTGSPGEKVSGFKDWTSGSVTKNLLQLSWPAILLTALYSVNLLLEMIWVGKLGPASIAGIGVGGIMVLLVLAIKNGLSIGERAMVARYVGAGDMPSANRITGQSYLISAVYSLLIALIGVFCGRQLFGLFGLEPDAVSEGVKYLQIVTAGWVTEAFWMTSFAVMQASGDTMTPLKIAIVIRLFNAVLCPFMVLGWWIFPALGVTGAAITYISTTGLGMLICFWVLFSGKTRLQLTIRDFYPNLNTIWRILKIGLPASVSGLGKALGDLILTSLMVPFGTVPLAAHNLLARIESFVNTPGIGLGTGAGVLVGQNLGARKPEQAAKSGWLAMLLVLGFMAVCSVILLIWAENIISLFNSDPELVKTGGTFLRIAVAGYLAMSVVIVLQNSVTGAVTPWFPCW